MDYCNFCKEINDRKNHKYCKKCNQLYIDQQKSLSIKSKNIDSDLVNKKNFRFCTNCNKKLSVPRSHYCKTCNLMATKDYFIKIRLRAITQYFLRNGHIKKSKHCLLCLNKKIEGHHENYNKPLEIMWLCKKHHYAVHVQKNHDKSY